MKRETNKQDSVSHNRTIVERHFLTLEEASEYMGLAKQTIYQYTSRREIPFYKLRGKKLYFLKQDLDSFIINEKNLVKSRKQIDQEATKQLILGE